MFSAMGSFGRDVFVLMLMIVGKSCLVALCLVVSVTNLLSFIVSVGKPACKKYDLTGDR